MAPVQPTTDAAGGDCWFRLPPGFTDVALDELEELGERLRGGPPPVASAAGAWDRRLDETGTLLRMLDDARLNGVMHASFGVHADDEEAPSISFLTLSDIDSGAPTPALAVAQCGLRMAGPALGRVRAARFLTLPCERPAALTTCVLPAPPQWVTDIAGLPSGGAVVFQARVAIARPQGSRVVIVDLTTTAVAMADEYTEIVLGVAGTVSFVDPDPRPRADVRPSRLLEALL